MWNRWLRHPRTTQEKRRNADLEQRPFVRKKRSSKRLPDSWDDIWVDGCGKKNVSWKRLRKTSYRVLMYPGG